MNFLLETLRLGVSNLALHKLRSLLTALGIIFGVAAVITMVAIGEGNKARALADIQSLGATNIIARSVKPEEPKDANESMRRLISYGLTRRDLTQIEATVSPVKTIVPLKQIAVTAMNGRHRAPAAVFGTTPDLINVASFRVARGRYLLPADLERADNVVVIGAELAPRLFPLEDPLKGTLLIEGQLFRVVGVLEPIGLAGGAGSALVGRDLNFDAHIPLTTAQSRFGDTQVIRQAGSFEARRVEITELYIQAPNQDAVRDVADQVELVLAAGHSKTQDTSLIVPLELLRQAERTQLMFNALMVAIASISLLVGGIGIMNIMLATVTERTREIGIRRALGATRRHVMTQFLVETAVLSCVGGLIGVALGVGGAMALTLLSERFPAVGKPQVTLWSILVSFAVATSVGIVFGLYPAARAAGQDPIVALRHD